MSQLQPIRLLYIDDDAGLGRLVERSLARHGFEVSHALSGVEGMERLSAAEFDIIALDHFMPGKEGLEVLADIQALRDPPPVVYVTGADEGRIAVAALKAGAADYVIKDVGGVFLDLLRSAAEQALEAARLRREKEDAEREIRQARERAEMLLREVNHRVANSLQLVASLVAMQKRAHTQDPIVQDTLTETQSRIAAIAQIHRRLYTSNDVRFVEMDTYLEGLVEELEGAMHAAGREHRISPAGGSDPDPDGQGRVRGRDRDGTRHECVQICLSGRFVRRHPGHAGRGREGSACPSRMTAWAGRGPARFRAADWAPRSSRRWRRT